MCCSHLGRRAILNHCAPASACVRNIRRLSAQRQTPPNSTSARIEQMARPMGTELWARITEVYREAGKRGATYQIETNPRVMSHEGVDFVVRLATAIRDKPTPKPMSEEGAGKEGDKPTSVRNPFLPYEEDLWVAHLSPTHTLLLNKFNVVEHHTLVVTRQFESQDDPLNASDLEATWRVMESYPSGAVAFYNCGPVSGRSQPHKHLQVVPLPMAGGGGGAFEPPILGKVLEGAEAAGAAPGSVYPVRSLPFQCYAAIIDDEALDASRLEGMCEQLRACCEAASASAGMGEASYNVVITPRFVLYVPRKQEKHRGVSVNSLGFAGTLLVRFTHELEEIEQEGCMAVLREVSLPWPQ